MNRLSNKWPNTENAIGYKFFAECCFEAVEADTWDSYKIHTLSTNWKVSDVLENCAKVSNLVFPKATLDPIISEANEGFQSDPVVLSILKEKNIPLSVLSIHHKGTTEEIRAKCLLFFEVISPSYRSHCERLIVKELSGGQDREVLSKLCRLLLSCLRSDGFHINYIRDCVGSSFVDVDVKKCDKYFVERFYKRFPKSKSSNYDVVMAGDVPYMSFLAGFIKSEAFASLRKLKLPDETLARRSLGEGANVRYIKFSQLSSRDPYTAVENVNRFLSVPRALSYIFPSKVSEGIRDSVLVVSKSSKSSFVISRRGCVESFETSRAKSMNSARAAKRFSKYLWGHDKTRDLHSTKRIVRSFNSAALSAKSEDLETQLLTIWSGFEALLPEPTKDERKTPRIVHFVSLAVPCAVYSYPRSKYIECYRNLKAEYGNDFLEVLRDHGVGKTGSERLASVLVGDARHLDILLKVCKDSPLAVFRIESLSRLLQHPEVLGRKMTAHYSRVEWQFHRIYRERNEIVHKGASSGFLPGLVENAFFYYKSLVRSLERVHAVYGVSDSYASLKLLQGLYSERSDRIDKALSRYRKKPFSQKRMVFREIFSDPYFPS